MWLNVFIFIFHASDIFLIILNQDILFLIIDKITNINSYIDNNMNSVPNSQTSIIFKNKLIIVEIIFLIFTHRVNKFWVIYIL